MPFVAGKDQRAERARYREDELVVERAKYAAELLRKRIKLEGVIQAQYPQVFGFKAQQTIHNHFRSGKVTLIDLVRIVSTPGFDISIDDVLRTAISVVEPEEDIIFGNEHPARVESKKKPKPKPKEKAKRTTEKKPVRPALKGTEIDEELLLAGGYDRFSNLFLQAKTPGEVDD